MFNFLVSADENAWEGQPFVIELGRCVREYTQDEITEMYGDFTEKQVEKIRQLPTLFAYESHCEKDPKFGQIKNVRRKGDQVKIEYEIVNIDSFLSHNSLNELEFELEIGDWELRRTHWAIKNVDLIKELSAKGIRLPGWVQGVSKGINIINHNFDVALSFPGEFRPFVEKVAANLEELLGSNKYFYDNNYKAQLARPALDEVLQDIYRYRSKLIVVFLCQAYGQKEWCGLEFRAIKEIIMERRHEMIMFVKMDKGQVKGVFKTDGYIDGQTHQPDEVAGFIKERVLLLSSD